jgi:hypothetical protein
VDNCDVETMMPERQGGVDTYVTAAENNRLSASLYGYVAVDGKDIDE